MTRVVNVPLAPPGDVQSLRQDDVLAFPVMTLVGRATRRIEAAIDSTSRSREWSGESPIEWRSLSLGYGTAGVAHLLSALLPIAGHADWSPRLRTILASTPVTVDGADPSLFNGSAGVGWTASLLGHRHGDSAVAARGAELLRATVGRPNLDEVISAKNNSVINGLSGVGLAALTAGRELSDNQLLGSAAGLGREITSRNGSPQWFEVAPGSPLGFGHGVVGVAFFLATLGKALGDQTWVDQARRGLDSLEGELLSEFGRNCLPAHTGARDATLTWEAGLSGYARTRLQVFLASRTEADRRRAISAFQDLYGLFQTVSAGARGREELTAFGLARWKDTISQFDVADGLPGVASCFALGPRLYGPARLGGFPQVCLAVSDTLTKTTVQLLDRFLDEIELEPADSPGDRLVSLLRGATGALLWILRHRALLESNSDTTLVATLA